MNRFLTLNTSYLKKGFLSALVIIGLGISGCDILKVNNPNSLVEGDLDNPAAAPSIANGAEATVTNALGSLLASYATATDEVTWVGTRDAWEQLDQGEVGEPINEFTDGAFRDVSEARWTADNAILRLEKFREEGTLQGTLPLLRSYVYGAIIYISIADAFDDFVFSDRRNANPPVGEDNMHQLYDTAIDYLDKGLALASDGSEWETRLIALRARAHYSRALWYKLNPEVNTDEPLIQNDQAVADAQAALANIKPDDDWSYQMVVTPDTPNNYLGSEMERSELRFGDAYIQPTENNKGVESVTLQDPIDGITAPYLETAINTFVEEQQYADVTVISARELYLIIAEDALARSVDQDFEDAINALRSLDDDLSDYTGQIDELELLKHSRRVNLFAQNRRLADLYRFGDSSPEWTPSRVEVGTFFPITITEIRANPNVSF